MEHKKILQELKDIKDLISLIIFNLEDDIPLKEYRNLILLLYKVIDLELIIKKEIEK